jgi:hypothetical protein
MQVVSTVASILAILLYLLVLFVLTAGIWFGITAAVGVVGGVFSVPLLYVLPDVRRFLIRVSGGRPDTAPWRVAFRPRYLLGSAAFGIVYGLVFVPLLGLLGDLGLFPGRGEPTPILLVIPVTVAVSTALLVYAVHRYSDSWTPEMSARAVLVQWVVFLLVVVAAGTGIAAFVAT